MGSAVSDVRACGGRSNATADVRRSRMQAQEAFERDDEAVDLNFKAIGDDGGVTVAAMLAASTTVKKLSMRRCELAAKAARALADAMMKNRSLVELDLWSEFARGVRICAECATCVSCSVLRVPSVPCARALPACCVGLAAGVCACVRACRVVCG